MPEQLIIQFFFEDVRIGWFCHETTEKWLTDVIRREGMEEGNIAVIFCDDRYLLEINKKHLNHDTLTDVIAFDYKDDFEGISGDVFISYNRVKENAVEYKSTEKKELYRVILHGILHLAGYQDKEESDKKIMRRKEDEYLTLLNM